MRKTVIFEKVDWVKYRSRIEHEDNLLNARVNVFLVLNALGAAALSLAKSDFSQIGISLVVLIVNLLLFLCTIQTARVLRKLTTIYIKEADDPIDNIVRISLNWLPRWIRSTYILGIWVPGVLVLSWFSVLLFLMAID